mgnify:CR=1 FL=1
MNDRLKTILAAFTQGQGHLLMLTGEGVAAECGLAPFREDPRPFSFAGSDYTSRDLLTRRLYDQAPEAVWAWHLTRLEEARQVQPGPAHRAVAAIARAHANRVGVITECVDGLQRRTPLPPDRFFEPQGNLFAMRCLADCTLTVYPVPRSLYGWKAEKLPERADWQLPRCPACGGPVRPHVLWRDEIYNEVNYRLNTILAEARRTDLLIVAGFSGHTNLANKVAWEVSLNHRARIIDINPVLNPVAALARRTGGEALQASPAEVLPQVQSLLKIA